MIMPNKQQFTLYQRLELPSGSYYTAPPDTVRRSDYQRVATVVASSLEEVFASTQHLDAPWWKHPTVTLARKDRFRSTSVGDVIADEEGCLWLVKVVGFSQIAWEKEPAPVIEFTVQMRIDDQAAFWRWALGLWRSQWGPHEALPESARSLGGIALEAFILSNPTWGSELAIEFEDYCHRVLEGHPFAYPDVLTIELPDE
jgi:hypothetical protein